MTGTENQAGLPLDGHNVLPVLQGDSAAQEPRRFWQWNGYAPIRTTNAAMRAGDWKLVRPAIDGIRYATSGDERKAQRYVELDIAYKYQPEQITGIRTDLEPDRIIPAPPPPELYNIAQDPQEEHNLAAQEPARVQRMLAQLETWFDEVDQERRTLDSDELGRLPA